MDGIAAISGRIATIRSTIAAMSPEPVAPVTGTSALGSTSAGTSASAGSTADGSFASILASQLSGSQVSGSQVSGTQTVVASDGTHSSEQMTNAAAIVDAGKKMGLSVRDETIGVMTALGESSLTVVNHGDVAGPDSRGLFQQRANGAWGTLSDRMNPAISATNFYNALTRVTGRDSMSPTAVAHAVQRNADPSYYTKYWNDAVGIVAKLGAT